jgi:signal transduction histidine kinase
MTRSQRFQRRIILIVLLFGCVMILFSHWRDQSWLVERRLARLEQEAADTVSRLSGLLQHLSRRQQEQAAELEMSYVALSPQVELGVVCNLHGQILYSSKAQWRGLNVDRTAIGADWPLVVQAFESMNTMQSWDRETGNSSLTVVAPFYESYDAESKSAVVIRYETKSAAAQSRDEATRESLRQAAVLLALCLLLWFALDVLVVQLRQAENMVLDIAEQERRKIGAELHDDLCQRLTATKLKAEVIKGLMPADESKATALSSQVAEELSESVVIARSMAHGLSPVGLELHGLKDALEDVARFVSRTYEVSCSVECEDVHEYLTVGAQELVFRIAQELAVNAGKHSKPRSINLSVRPEEGQVILRVIHDGVPFDDTVGGKRAGMGLYLMRQRLRTLFATMHRQVENGDPKISIATVRIPSKKVRAS